jgi:ACT domain-containing protein
MQKKKVKNIKKSEKNTSFYCQNEKFVIKSYKSFQDNNKRRRFIMKAVVTVTGKDKVGIIAMASAECSKYGANIEDISQTVLGEYFAMIMLVSLEGLKVKFSDFADGMSKAGEESGVDIRVMHEDIFNTMHRI